MLRYEKQLFHVLVLLSISILVIPKYYITGDGASHVYNSKVLMDYLLGNERVFYKEFYQINKTLDPNWMSHILLGFLLQIFPAWLSDKIIQITYIVLFAYGFRYLLKTLNPNSTFLSFLFFPFAFTQPFQNGFYNYCLGLALLLWVLIYFLKTKNNTAFSQFNLCWMLLFITLTHGMPAFFCMLLIGLITVVDNIENLKQKKWTEVINNFSKLIMVGLPSVLLLLIFTLKRGIDTVPNVLSYGKKMERFFVFFTSQIIHTSEKYASIFTSVLVLISLLFFVFFVSKKTANAKIKWVFLFMVVYTLYSYITSPHSIGGAGSISMRLAFLPPFFLLVFFSFYHWQKWFQSIFIVCSFAVSILFLTIRFPIVLKANNIANEMMEANKFIEDKSVVLDLHFNDKHLLPNNDSLYHRDGSFIHLTQFIGAEKNKHIVFVNNYEAEINYFPVQWRQNKNIRDVLPTLIAGNYPPCGNYQLYEQYANCTIDYILFQNWNQVYENKACVVDLIHLIKQNYTLIFTSSHQNLLLFKKN